ncbi:MAG: cytochrome ubiquinol oxidase subunit I [Longimicrobiales bacterium]
MEVSLGFHMVFAALGIGLPLLLLIAEAQWLRTGNAHYKELARQWAKATALTFAVGAVSGTALSFELGLLWPRFMETAGATIGSAFTLEAYAFFTEAIFLGLYLYGWDRLSPRAHWLTAIPVALSGLASGVLVVAVNAWMQHPFTTHPSGELVLRTDPLAPFASPAWLTMALHSSLACYVATGFATAGVYAAGLLRGHRDAYHRSGLRIAMAVGGVAALLQPLSGDISARSVARLQPIKLAAMESLFETRANAPLTIGGIPDVEARVVRFGIEVPGALSFLAHHDPDAVVTGLADVPRELWPNVMITHLAFQIMVGCGMVMVVVALWYWWSDRQRRDLRASLLRVLLAAAPLGFLALEAGWVVTEVGRQPWIIYQVMRTQDAVTSVQGISATFIAFTILYAVLGIALLVLLQRLAYNRRVVTEQA